MKKAVRKSFISLAMIMVLMPLQVHAAGLPVTPCDKKTTHEFKDVEVDEGSDTCGYEYDSKSTHNYTYTVNEKGNKVTERCDDNGCDHLATAELETPQKCTYMGHNIMPAVMVYSDNWAGERPTELFYQNNLNVSTSETPATVTIGTDDWELTGTFHIVQADIAYATITFDPEGSTYNGTMQMPAVSVKWNNRELKEGYILSWDKNGFVDVDTYTVTIEGVGNFKGSLSKSYKIDKQKAPDITFPETVNSIIYGQQVEDAGLTFTENTYGTFQWNTPNDVPNAGYGDYAVEFKPYEWALDHYNWEGLDGQNGMQWIESRKALCAAVGVKVDPVDITEAVVSVTDAAYTGKALTPDVTVVFGAKTLNKDTDYTVEYVNNVDTGTAEVIIKGKDNYTGTTQKNFQIDYLKNAPDAEISGILGENDWYKSIVFLKAPNGYKIAKTLNESWDACLVYPEEQNEEITYYLKKDISDEIAQKTRNLKIDMTAPVGTVELVDRGSWGDFINDLTFGLFFKDEATVKINSTDTLSGVNKVQYFASDKAMNLDDVKAVDEWTDYNGSFGVTVEDAKRFIYYVCISDHAGNKTYLSTDGAEYDLTAPVISGIEDGETYYTAQPVTVTDENIDTITVNGSEVTGEIVLENNADAVYTVEAVDKAGNVTTFTITMKSVALVGKNIDDLTEKNVTSEDQDEIQEVIDEINELLKDEDMPEVEKKVLQEKKSEAENLIEKIEEAQKAISTKNIAKVKDITSKNVKKSDKKDLEHAKADLEKALKEYGSNYTDAQKKAIQKEIKRIEEALKVIGNMNQTANKTSPKTGDYNNLWVWFVMLMVSGAGVLGITQHLKEVDDEKKNKHI